MKDQARRIADRPDSKGQTTVPKSETKSHPPAGKQHALDKDERGDLTTRSAEAALAPLPAQCHRGSHLSCLLALALWLCTVYFEEEDAHPLKKI